MIFVLDKLLILKDNKNKCHEKIVFPLLLLPIRNLFFNQNSKNLLKFFISSESGFSGKKMGDYKKTIK